MKARRRFCDEWLARYGSTEAHLGVAESSRPYLRVALTAIEALGLATTLETGLPSWDGEKLDLYYVIWLLLQNRRANGQSAGYVGGGLAGFL